MEEQIFSQSISQIDRLLKTAKQKYETHLALLHEQEAKECDILHDLELNPHNAVELVQLSIQLRDVLRTRRYHKDKTALYKPLVQYMNDPVNTKAVGRFSQLISELKKEEKYQSGRTYKKRYHHASQNTTED